MTESTDIQGNQILELSPKFKGGLIFVSMGNRLYMAYTENMKNGGSAYVNGTDAKFFVKDNKNSINFYFENERWYAQNCFNEARTVSFYLVSIYK